jgi:hypothetical protein
MKYQSYGVRLRERVSNVLSVGVKKEKSIGVDLVATVCPKQQLRTRSIVVTTTYLNLGFYYLVRNGRCYLGLADSTRCLVLFFHSQDSLCYRLRICDGKTALSDLPKPQCKKLARI